MSIDQPASEDASPRIIRVGRSTIGEFQSRAEGTVLEALEKRLAPVLAEMDEARLYRIASGDRLKVPGFKDADPKAVEILARYWSEKRLREKPDWKFRISLAINVVLAIATIWMALQA